MSSTDEKIAAAKAARVQAPIFRDVFVTLDTTLYAQREQIQKDLDRAAAERDGIVEAASQTLALDPDTKQIDARIKRLEKELAGLDESERDTLMQFRVYKAPGDAWVDFVSAHPARIDSPMDRGCGYNVPDGTKDYVVEHGRVVDGGAEEPLTVEQADEIWPLIGGSQFEELADTVYGLNVAEPRNRVERLKNSFEAATASAKK
jgi:hypothetical protein